MFTTGLMGIFGLWSFSCVFNVGGAGFFRVMCVCVLLFKENEFTFFHLSSEVGLIFVCWVCGEVFSVVLGKEDFYFLVVFMFVYDDHSFSFVGSCDYGSVLAEFVV